MAFDTTDGFFAPPPELTEEEKLREAHAKALAELQQLQAIQAAKEADFENERYSRHEVAGLGRYVIPRVTGWKPLLELIHDRGEINIDFSANVYPNFDGIIGEHFQSPHLLDPLDDQYESREFGLFGRKKYEDLRDNLAAVRNFLMISYFATEPAQLSEAKAKQAMAEIAAYVGDGLYNNFLWGGIIPNHDPSQPHIDMHEAMEPNGRGAQYIYEQILKRQRQSDWWRPLTAVMAFFGGHAPEDWKLPDSHHTHFTDFFEKDIAPTTQVPGNASMAEINGAIMASVANVEAINRRQAELNAIKEQNAQAREMNDLGDHLLFRAQESTSVALMDVGARQNAVELAKKILKGFKLSIGNLNVMDGLKLNPADPAGTIGQLDSVARIYTSLLAWAKSTGDSAILQNPAVTAAAQALGQLGYLAKYEALRLAEAAKNTKLMAALTEQLRAIASQSPAYVPKAGETFNSLFDKVQSGIDAVMNRTQEVSVSGGQVGHTLGGSIGAMHSDPVAGAAQQAGAQAALKRNAEALAADQAMAEAKAQQINSQLAAQARKSGQTAPAPTPSRGGTVGRASLNAAQANKARVTTNTSTTRTTAPITSAQPNRNPTLNPVQAARANAQHHHDEEHEREEAARRLNAQKATAAIKATAATKNATKVAANKTAVASAAKRMDTIDLSGIKPWDMKNVTGKPITPGRSIDPAHERNSSVHQTGAAKPAAPTVPGAAPTAAHHEDEHLKPIQPPAGVPPRGGYSR